MKTTVNIPLERLEEMLKAAYLDGAEDGYKGNDTFDKFETGEAWTESVTADQFEALKERIRNGRPA